MLRSKILKIKYLILTNLATNTTLNAKINEVKDKIPSINDLATTTAFTVENKIPNHSKYTTTPESNKLTAEHFNARLRRANLASKVDIADFVNLNKKVTSNKSKHLLAENEFKKLQYKIEELQTFNASLFKVAFSMMEHKST